MVELGRETNRFVGIARNAMDSEMNRGVAMATRAILSGLLVELHRSHGEEAVRRVRLSAQDHLGEAIQTLREGAISQRDREGDRQIASDAEGFLNAAFRDAYVAE